MFAFCKLGQVSVLNISIALKSD